MKTSLKHIANIQTGVFAKPIVGGEVVYLQAKHFDENGKLIGSLHPDLKADDITKKHLLRQKDVIFASKGTRNFAAHYNNESLPAVASTSFFVIRLKEDFMDEILPEYLVWFINHASSQNYLKGKAIGTSIVSISKTVLEELEISIPELQTQQSILEIYQLRNKEKEIIQKIETLKEKQIQQQIINAIK